MNNEEPKLSTMIILALFSISAALHNVDYIHRGRVCRNRGLQGSAFFACVKNTPLLHVNAGTSRLSHGETHSHSTIKPHLSACDSSAYSPCFRNAAPNDVQGCLVWRQSCGKAWRSLLYPLLENEIMMAKPFTAWVSRAPTSPSSGPHSVWLVTCISVFLQAAPCSKKVPAFLRGRE